MKTRTSVKYIASVLIAGVLWGFMGLFRRQMGALGYTAGDIVLLRCGVAALAFLVTGLLRSPADLKICLRDLWCFLGAGCCSLLFFSYCYYQAMNYMSLSVAAILLYTAPVIVVVLSAVLFRETFTRRKLLALALAFLGCCLVSGLGSETRLSATGILYGLGAGLGYALYSIFARIALEKGYPSNTVTFYAFLFAALGAGVIWGVREPMTLFVSSSAHVGWAVATGLITGFLPYMLYTFSLTGLETGKASIYANVEPVVATLVGISLFHEPLTLMNACGILSVFAAVVMLSMPNKNP